MLLRNLFIVSVFLFLFPLFVSALDFNGTVYDAQGIPLNTVNVSVTIKDSSWSQVWQNQTNSNSLGAFNITLLASGAYFYQPTIVQYNATFGHAERIGQNLPFFPYGEITQLVNMKYYLKEAGSINLTVVNSSGQLIPFAYQIKDTSLGYPVASAFNNNNVEIRASVLKNKNYSIMVYPRQSGSEKFVPVSFNWNNFSATSSYIFGLSSYNVTTKTLHKQFNVTQSQARITGYLDSSQINNVAGWNNITVIPFLLEPGNMVVLSGGTLPYNASSWFSQGDNYTLSTGFYNISVPYAPSETVEYMLFVAATNNSYSYGGYRNITVAGDTRLNFTLYGLLGHLNQNISNANITMNDASSGNALNISTQMQKFYLVNSTNYFFTDLSAHIETAVDYSSYGAIAFTFMTDIQQGTVSSFLLPLLNVTGIKSMDVYSMSRSPKRVSTLSETQIVANPNVTLSVFSPSTINDDIADSGIFISLYRSNSTCDVPVPPVACLLTSNTGLNEFNPMSSVMGGGALSFRMGIPGLGIEVHYVNVDLLASGPPDALFDSHSTESASGSSFGSVMRFGSTGPTIYDHVLVSLPYSSSLDESKAVQVAIPKFYDDSWNVIWDTSNSSQRANAVALAGNYSHYSTRQSEWQTLMSPVTCGGLVPTASAPCYLDTVNNKVWLRLPHFSGTGPTVSGSKSSSSSSSSSGGGGGSVSSVYTGQVKDLGVLLPGAKSVVMSEDSTLEFMIEDVSHSLVVNVVDESSGSVSGTLSSTPQAFRLSVGEEKNFDLDGDSLSLFLEKIVRGRAHLTVRLPETVSDVEPSVAAVVPDEIVAERFVASNVPVAEEASYGWLVTFVILILVLAVCGYLYYSSRSKRRRF